MVRSPLGADAGNWALIGFPLADDPLTVADVVEAEPDSSD